MFMTSPDEIATIRVQTRLEYRLEREPAAHGASTPEYCGICDPLTGFTSIMTTSLRNNLQDVTDFYRDVAGDHLPAIVFVRPFESQAGHPANSTLKAYEDFVMDLVSRVQSNPSLWAKTAILVTVDEGGGYYDSGYIQPIDFFGDGTRIPLIAGICLSCLRAVATIYPTRRCAKTIRTCRSTVRQSATS